MCRLLRFLEPVRAAALADLVRLGVVEEVTGKRRGRVYSYRRYVEILSEGTEPLLRQ